MKDKGYIGKIKNAGGQTVTAPHQTTGKQTGGKMHTGNDLRVQGGK